MASPLPNTNAPALAKYQTIVASSRRVGGAVQPGEQPRRQHEASAAGRAAARPPRASEHDAARSATMSQTSSRSVHGRHERRSPTTTPQSSGPARASSATSLYALRAMMAMTAAPMP